MYHKRAPSFLRFILARLKSLDVDDRYIEAEGEKQTVHEIIGIAEQDKIYTSVILETGWFVEYAVSRQFFLTLPGAREALNAYTSSTPEILLAFFPSLRKFTFCFTTTLLVLKTRKLKIPSKLFLRNPCSLLRYRLRYPH